METVIIAILGAVLAGGGWKWFKGRLKSKGKEEAIREADIVRREVIDEHAEETRKAEKKKERLKDLSWEELREEMERMKRL